MKYLTLMRKIRSEVRERKTDLTVRYRKKVEPLSEIRKREENKDRSTREDRNIQRLCNI